MKNRDWLILAMILVPLIGILFNIYALFLFIPLGFFFKNKKNYWQSERYPSQFFVVGRFLLNSTEENSSIGRDVNSLKPEAVIRGGLSIGKRF